jgi:opacity protein-like surface antigen
MKRTLITAVAALGLAAFVFAPAAQAQTAERVNISATAGPTFGGNVGTTFGASGAVTYNLTDLVGLSGELGMIRHGAFEDTLAGALPGIIPATDRRVNGVHANANLYLRPWAMDGERLMPYVTAGLGTFTATTIASGVVGDARLEERRRDTDLATNIGAGLTYRLTDVIGVTGDYRTFFVHRSADTPRVHRFTTGVTFFLR